MIIDWLIKSGFTNRRGLWIPWLLELAPEVEADVLLACWAAHDFHRSEISGLGRLESGENMKFFVSEIIIPFQKCNNVDTTILGEVMESAFQELEAAGKSPLEYNLWWHSHVKGPAEFSSIDDGMIEQRLYTMMTSVHAGYLSRGEAIPDEAIAGPFFSLVGNVYRRMTARCDFLYRYRDEYRPCTFGIPVLKTLSNLSKAEQKEILTSRAPAITTLVRQRVTRTPLLLG